MTQKEQVEKELEILGRKVVFKKGKGRHMIQAGKLAGDEQERVQFALLSLLVEVDGKRLLMEDWEDQDIKFVSQVLIEFGKLFS